MRGYKGSDGFREKVGFRATRPQGSVLITDVTDAVAVASGKGSGRKMRNKELG